MSDTERSTPAHENVHHALLAFQAEAPVLQRVGLNPHFESKFAPLEHVMELVVPVLNKHGLVWVTLPDSLNGEPCLRYRLVHAASGTTIEGAMLLQAVKKTPQDQGSAITYARRYSMMAVLGLTANKDDDGARASRPPAAARRPKTAAATFEKLRDAAKGLQAKQIKMAMAAAGVPYDAAAIFDHITAEQAAVLLPELTGIER